MKILVVVCAVLASGGMRPGPPVDLTPVVDGGALVVSRKAVDHVVNHETGGYAYYGKFYERPQDPKFASGVTVGFGYDLRYHTRAQIRKDWAGVASASEIDAMCSVAGLDGSVYKRIRYKVHITWEEAMIVFKRTTVPRWCAKTASAYRIADSKQLHPHLNGALMGNTFNRGSKMSGDRCREKRQIRDAIAGKRWSKVPAYFEAQQRLWPTHAGLKRRRREEGGLAREALEFAWWQH